MKKAILLCTIVLAILIGGVLALVKYNRDDYDPNVKSFQLSDYRHFKKIAVGKQKIPRMRLHPGGFL